MLIERLVYRGLVAAIMPFYFIYLGILACRNAFKKDYQDQFLQRLGCYTGIPNKQNVVIIAEGLGEYRSIKALLATLSKQYTQYEFIIMMTDIEAMRYAKQNNKQYAHYYLPYEAKVCINSFLNHFKPKAMIIIERALWPNLYYYTKRKDIPCLLLSGRISHRSVRRYKYAKRFFLSIYRGLNAISMQDSCSEDRLVTLGLKKSDFASRGNLKYSTDIIKDEVYQAMYEKRWQWLDIKKETFILLGASTHANEESLLMRILLKLQEAYPQIQSKLILIPRDITRAIDLEYQARELSLPAVIESNHSISTKAKVLIIDSYGKMLDYLAWANCAYIGGSWIEHGGHNPLEAIKMRTYAISGPHMSNFTQSWEDITKRGVGKIINSEAELYTCIEQQLLTTEATAEFKLLIDEGSTVLQNNLNLIAEHLGA